MEWKLYEADFYKNADKKIEWIEEELEKIRVGKVSPKILEDIQIDAYGEPSKLFELANISAFDAKTLIVKPYDKTIIKIIGSEIHKLNLGGSLQIDADLVRITFQAPTEETRKQASLKVKKSIDQCKVFIRDVRHSILNLIKKDEDLNEDSLHWYKEEVDSLTKKYNNKLDILQEKKIQSIMKI